MKFRAAVLRQPRGKLTIETVEAGSLKPDDVLVRIRATSLCHTDLEVIEGQLVMPMPIVLGHEAAGTIEKIGGSVHGLAPGDPAAVMLGEQATARATGGTTSSTPATY